jgi:hypothetical protein
MMVRINLRMNLRNARQWQDLRNLSDEAGDASTSGTIDLLLLKTFGC